MYVYGGHNLIILLMFSQLFCYIEHFCLFFSFSLLWEKKENLDPVLSFELPVLPGVHKQPAPRVPKLTSQVLKPGALWKRGHLSWMRVWSLPVKKEFVSGDCSFAAIQIVNQVREEMELGEASDLPSEVLGKKEPKLCALVPSSP